MKKQLFAMLLIVVSTIFIACEGFETVKKQDDAKKSEDARKRKQIELNAEHPYEITFVSVEYDKDKITSTYTYTVERIGKPQGNGLSHLIFSLGLCADKTDILNATIDGKKWNKIETSEGKGTGCYISDTTQIIKFDDLPDQLSEGVHTFTFTLSGYLGTMADIPTWTKAGKNCYEKPVIGPCCFPEHNHTYTEGDEHNHEEHTH